MAIKGTLNRAHTVSRPELRVTTEEVFSVPSDLTLISNDELRELEVRGLAYAGRLIEGLDRISAQLSLREEDVRVMHELRRNREADQLAMNRDPEAWARLGRAIRSERGRYGWSRKQLAKASGVSEAAVQNAENGRVPVRRWPQTIARIERSLGWHPGTAKAVTEGGTPDSPPFPLEITLIEKQLRRSVWVEIRDGDVAAAAGVSIDEWWRIISRISPPVRASAKTLAHIALALHIDDRELTVVGRADAAEELRALPFTVEGTRIPQLSEDDPRFNAFLAIAGTFADQELREAVRFLGFKVPAYDHDGLMEMLLTLVEYDSKLPE